MNYGNSEHSISSREQHRISCIDEYSTEQRKYSINSPFHSKNVMLLL